MDKIRNFRDGSMQEYNLTSVNDQQTESDSIWNTLHDISPSRVIN